MEITECEILPNGKRQIHTLFRYHIKENTVRDGKVKIIGNYEKVKDISKSLQKRLLENGMPLSVLESLLSKNIVEEGEEK
jgi:pilus assembly protein CpaF